MGRPVKSQAREDARRDFVEAAWRLFSRFGYDATPVSAIIEEVGLSKGAFYYYFTSKEDILDAVVAMIIEEIARSVDPIPSDTGPSPAEKISRFMRDISEWKMANVDVMLVAVEVIYRGENAIMRHKMNSRAVEKLAPVLADIIAQGIDEGEFDVEDAEETAEMILRFFNAMAEMLQAPFFASVREGSPDLELFIRRGDLIMSAVERILGVRKGSIFSFREEMEKRLEQLFARTDQ